jgi:hypothetical protein
MVYPARTSQLHLELGPWPDPALAAHSPQRVEQGYYRGQWVIEVPGSAPHYRPTEARANALYQRLLELWRAQGYYVEINGDLYDMRGPGGQGRRLRLGYRELFYQIKTGLQLRATLRFLGATSRRHHYLFTTDWGGVLCPACVLTHTADVTRAIRHDDDDDWKVIGCELNRHVEAQSCDHCFDEIPSAENWL